MKSIFFLMIVVLIIFIAGCKPEIVEEPLEEINVENMYMVSHSEYWSNEDGQIIARLLNYRGDAILNANCTVDIFYPNKTYFKQDEDMNFSIDSYYYTFVTPETEGVYEYKATCEFDTKTRSVMNSFHLSPALNLINTSYYDLQGRLINLTDLNNAQFNNLTYNLSQIKEDTDYIRQNLEINNTAFQNNILSELASIQQFCDDGNTSTSNLCLWTNETRTRLIGMNATVDTYLFAINQTVDISADVIAAINETVSNISQFTPDDRALLQAIYNCLISGIGCHTSPNNISENVWEYSGRYTHGEEILP